MHYVNYTRSARKDRESLVFDSSVAEHAVLQNHIIDWEGSDSLAKDNTWSTRRIRESIWIKRKGGVNTQHKLLNEDDGAYKLSNLYDQLISVTSPKTDVTNSSSSS